VTKKIASVVRDIKDRAVATWIRNHRVVLTLRDYQA
jgi:hypothetical protein